MSIKRFNFKLIALAVVFMASVAVSTLVPVHSASAIKVIPSCDDGAAGASSSTKDICGDESAGPDKLPKLVQNVINTVLIILGMAAVIMIIVGGVRYVTSNGDPQQVKSAKDTVMYSVIGVIVAIMAFAIVNFVLAVMAK